MRWNGREDFAINGLKSLNEDSSIKERYKYANRRTNESIAPLLLETLFVKALRNVTKNAFQLYRAFCELMVKAVNVIVEGVWMSDEVVKSLAIEFCT